jgi:hypothetical protein
MQYREGEEEGVVLKGGVVDRGGWRWGETEVWLPSWVGVIPYVIGFVFVASGGGSLRIPLSFRGGWDWRD